jgi:hypothetical protein
MNIFDPVTGDKLKIYGSKAPSDECYEVHVDALIRNIARLYMCSELEATRMLQNSDIDNPVTYYDEVFWAE